jgi:HK97 family phage major capsid protein
MSITDLIRQRLSYKFSITQEKGFITGDGVNKALGVNVADSNGVSTSRDYTGSTSLVISPGDIIGMYFFLKSGYSARGTWLASRDALSDIRQLKDVAGNYLWQPFDMPGRQLVGGNPGTIMGRPYLISEYCKFKTSNVWVAGDYAVTFGDFSYYHIADSLEMTMKVLNELYARTNQIGIIGRMEVDGQPVLENAFVRLKIKA